MAKTEKKFIRQQRDINRTRSRLHRWVSSKSECKRHLEVYRGSLFAAAAALNDISVDHFAQRITTDRMIHAFSGIYTLEESLVSPWFNRKTTPLDEYIRQRGQHESSTGRQYLQALQQSTIALWQILDTVPGHSMTLRSVRKDGRQETVSVREDRATMALNPGDYLVTRLLHLPAAHVMTAFLPIEEQDIPGTFMPVAAHRWSHHYYALWANRLLMLYPQNKAPWQWQAASSDSSPDQDKSQQKGNHTASEQPEPPTDSATPPEAISREKLLGRIRKLFAMSCQADASPHEAEIALRRCQSLMSRYGITEEDLTVSEFGKSTFRAPGRQVPAHVKWFCSAICKLHSVLFVTGYKGAEFRGYDIDVKVACMTLEYLENSIERSLSARRKQGNFPPGRSAAYDYRVAFAQEVYDRVTQLVEEREKAEQQMSTTGKSLSVKKMEIVDRECGQDLVTDSWSARRPRSGEASAAGREDGSRVSLDPQVKGGNKPIALPGTKG